MLNCALFICNAILNSSIVQRNASISVEGLVLIMSVLPELSLPLVVARYQFMILVGVFTNAFYGKRLLVLILGM